MSIKVYLPDRLRYSIAKGKGLFKVNSRTIGGCLDDVIRLIPGTKQALYCDTEKKALHSHIKLLVNKKSADAEGLVKKVKERDEIAHDTQPVYAAGLFRSTSEIFPDRRTSDITMRPPGLKTY